jgi:hypothetical protein
MNSKTPAVINYQALLITNSWWKDIKGRIWVVISRQFTPESNGDDIEFIPNTVTLLEQFKTDPVKQPWDYVVELIESGKFIPIKQS